MPHGNLRLRLVWLLVTEGRARAVVTIASIVAVFATAVVLRRSVGPTEPRDIARLTAGELGFRYEFVFIARSTCSACNDPTLPDAVRALQDRVRAEAVLASHSYSALAIITDEDAPTALRFGERFGTFDEWALGNSWNNSALRRLQDRTPGGILATPAIYVTRRFVDVGPGGRATFQPETIVMAIVGSSMIKDLASKAGTTIFPLEASPSPASGFTKGQ